MSSPNMISDPNTDLIRRIIEARQGYERLCGVPPTCIHVNGSILKALISRGFYLGVQLAGMTVIASPESVADQAICSRDPDLFKPVPVEVPKPARVRGKAR